MTPTLPDTNLTTRPGLPPHLRALVEELPRRTWEQQPGFGGLAAFWLDRHLDFRHLTGLLQTDVETLLDGGMSADNHAQRLAHYGTNLLQSLHGHHQIEDDHYFPMMAKMDPRVSRGFTLLDADHHAQRLAHYGTNLLQSLHGHHQIEDDHYFPMMAKMDPRVSTGFTLLDADHHALDTLIAGFASAANAVLQTQPDAPQKFHATLVQFNHLLIRHLEDEEDIVIPMILKHGLR